MSDVHYGPGIASLTTLAFVILKLTGVIKWSWLWVLSPLWISFGLFVLLLLMLVGGATLAALMRK